MRKPLQVMKFGGTSVGDASCIEKVVGIIRNASRDCSVAVVVSAMGGVTNRLIEAAIEAKAGNETCGLRGFCPVEKAARRGRYGFDPFGRRAEASAEHASRPLYRG